MKTFYVLPILLLFSVQINAQYDGDGWTVLDSSRADKIMYISTSDGDDAKGRIYSYPTSYIGDDPPQNPLSNISAFRTVGKAIEKLAPAESAWILLKRGDVFDSGIDPLSGKSVDRPLVYASYGTANELPLMKTGNGAGIEFNRGSLKHF